uniref:Uncharacterized protein n=1 Tax=Romanomermis culicivorax TaxID=13658 RepID=A0A915JAS7_ROMCU
MQNVKFKTARETCIEKTHQLGAKGLDLVLGLREKASRKNYPWSTYWDGRPTETVDHAAHNRREQDGKCMQQISLEL